jgi:hypothetical protein
VLYFIKYFLYIFYNNIYKIYIILVCVWARRVLRYLFPLIFVDNHSYSCQYSNCESYSINCDNSFCKYLLNMSSIVVRGSSSLYCFTGKLTFAWGRIVVFSFQSRTGLAWDTQLGLIISTTKRSTQS